MQGIQFPDFVERMRHYFDLGQRLLEAVNTFPKPVIARINGPCLGLAFGLVFTSDIRVASDTTYFQLPEVKEGLILVLSSPYIFNELTKLQAKEYALTGRAITATEAEGVFLNAVTKPSLLDEKTNYYLSMLMDSAPEAMTKTKMLIDMISSGGDIEQFSRIMEVTNDAVEGMFSSEEAIYGVHSVFMHKKKPDWNEYSNFKSKL
ncbi:ClpP/crotonase-like domain-containing protein [Circinella umbellata]|nr:ClpP/crotonase-like domain-containing protein [Circinella umbellata]